jgi:hypothetical protein
MTDLSKQAPAQDEREAFEAWAAKRGLSLVKYAGGMYVSDCTMWANIAWQERADRPAQTEQQPIGWITEDYLTDKSATTYSPEVADRWRAKGWPVSEIYAAPVAQTALIPERKPMGWQCEQGIYPADGWNAALDEVARLNAQTAPQPEQESTND